MPIDPEAIWKSKFKELPTDGSGGGAWAKNMADATDQRVTNKLGLNGLTGSITFTFKKDIFENMLKIIVPAPTPVAGAQQIAMAWQMAVQASTIVVAPGTYIGVPSPATIFSVVTSSVIDPPSVAIGSALIVSLLTAAQAIPDGNNNIIGPTLRKAFLSLTVTVTGLDSTPTPAGPLPLLSPLTPTI